MGKSGQLSRTGQVIGMIADPDGSTQLQGYLFVCAYALVYLCACVYDREKMQERGKCPDTAAGQGEMHSSSLGTNK